MLSFAIEVIFKYLQTKERLAGQRVRWQSRGTPSAGSEIWTCAAGTTCNSRFVGDFILVALRLLARQPAGLRMRVEGATISAHAFIRFRGLASPYPLPN